MQSLFIKCKNLVFNSVFAFLLFLIRSGVNTLQMKAFLHTLSSVLLHCGTALNAHKEAGWLTLHPQKLSCSEVLSLLQRWAALAHDASLLSALQTLINKHKVKELMGKIPNYSNWYSSFSKRHGLPIKSCHDLFTITSFQNYMTLFPHKYSSVHVLYMCGIMLITSKIHFNFL